MSTECVKLNKYKIDTKTKFSHIFQRQQENQKERQKMMCGGTTDMKQPDDEAREVLNREVPSTNTNVVPL